MNFKKNSVIVSLLLMSGSVFATGFEGKTSQSYQAAAKAICKLGNLSVHATYRACQGAGVVTTIVAAPSTTVPFCVILEALLLGPVTHAGRTVERLMGRALGVKQA